MKNQVPFTEELIDFGEPGIASIGVAIPKTRCTADVLAEAYDLQTNYITKGLKVQEVSVPFWDQDSSTLGLDSVYDALTKLPKDIIPTIGAVLVGSESPSQEVKNLGTTTTSFFGLNEEQLIALGSEFACVPQWMAIDIAYALIRSGRCETVITVGADVAQGAPGDALDLDTGAMASCIVVSKYNHILELVKGQNERVHWLKTLVRDHADFLRVGKYPVHGGAFTGEPAYFDAQLNTCNRTISDTKLAPEDINFFIAHYPNGNFPRKLGQRLGFKKEQYEPCMYAGDYLGNGYTASVGVSLGYVVNDGVLKEGETIIVSSFGSTLGAAAVIFRGTKLLPKYQKVSIPVKAKMDDKMYVTAYRRALNKRMVMLK
jgi:hydroxymethylglutaryl-CoA synthase